MSLAPYVHLDASLAGASAGDRVPLAAEVAHHLTRVLRLRDGADLEVADGAGSAALARLDGAAVVLASAATTRPAPAPALVLAQGLAKGRKLDEVVRQVTELGVDRFVPVAATRSVAQLDGDRAQRAVTRWAAVARAAAEQARRPHLPVVDPVRSSAAVPAALPEGCRLLVADPDADRSLTVAAAGLTPGAAVAVAIGPEGGWHPDELAGFIAAGAELVGLGPSVLRTEHAGAAALAVLGALSGRWEAPGRG